EDGRPFQPGRVVGERDRRIDEGAPVGAHRIGERDGEGLGALAATRVGVGGEVVASLAALNVANGDFSRSGAESVGAAPRPGPSARRLRSELHAGAGIDRDTGRLLPGTAVYLRILRDCGRQARVPDQIPFGQLKVIE